MRIIGPYRSLLLTALIALPAGLAAQEGQQPPPPVQQDSVELRAEREVFAYPEFERRNPFKPLTGSEGGPRFEQMVLSMVIHSTEPGRSVALLTASGGPRMTPLGAEQAAARGTTVPTARLRVGERWGNVRVVEIFRDRIIVDVEEFGLVERREMRLQTRGQGGS